MWIFPLAAGVVSALFAARLGRAWLQRRRPNLACWCLALAMFAIASFSAAIGIAFGWSEGLFRSYYYFGAIANVPLLGLGTIYLLADRKLAHLLGLVVLLALVVAAARSLSAGLDPSGLATSGIPAGRAVAPEGLRTLSRYYSFAGFFVVVGGALWSAARLMRAREPHLRRLAAANGLIAVGTFVVALGSGFARYGQGSVFAVGLLLGVVLMFAGFSMTRPRAG
jgi:hypothetical protein